MHLVKHIHVFAPTGPAADIQAQSVRLLFFQILCCVFLPSFRMCCVVLWFIYFLFIFFFRGAQPHHPSLWSDLRVVHIKAYACLPLWCGSSLKQVRFLSVSLYSRYLWMWVWPLKGSYAKFSFMKLSSTLLCSNVALSSLSKLMFCFKYQLCLSYFF